jgi:hydroxymethylglutaryl-CoA reductase (NADPH)
MVPSRSADGPANTIGKQVPVPRRSDDGYTAEAARERLEFLRARTRAALEHVSRCSFDAGLVRGNVEQFIGVAQVPIGIAGPLLVDRQPGMGRGPRSPRTEPAVGRDVAADGR